ncbi:MAG: acetyl-CoA carboxylase biotin carboxyl carrier protein subunit [Rhodoferax sp.]|nr:acetyl-CoA carboxylase biotin carboxyl carrier protein subunit [Rhodoferax sp.]MBP9929107.1 acetyl-CoA carboxylase biotin carboxyl carrier protein subunit [Rhodoferax sp.]HQX60725.1 acetyl-CoA carboxylase biotin carboxyl carrier protein subunit [Burkholderiaceae bacterium]HQZ06145.1 acetyl-CoA carboxylase biotin carboxyl carrier protein subunit [Burkholderiaceae bacterium]HRA61044.1 acetyl-CoA carboxylase biotin carboxyl carrier protein subunit [Burkholderiaceae bacterium]
MSEIALPSDVTGTVWKVEVAVGDSVTEDQTLLILESMKMEIPLAAPRAGTVVRLLVQEGEAVTEGQDLVVLA